MQLLHNPGFQNLVAIIFFTILGIAAIVLIVLFALFTINALRPKRGINDEKIMREYRKQFNIKDKR